VAASKGIEGAGIIDQRNNKAIKAVKEHRSESVTISSKPYPVHREKTEQVD
jgi:hypothetical protein